MSERKKKKKKKKKKHRVVRRRFGSIWMVCLSPGSWLSEDNMIAVVHMLAGTSQAAWELYLTTLAKGQVKEVPSNPDNVEFLCADHWASAFTLGELGTDIQKLANWAHNLGKNLGDVCKVQHQHRGWGFGPPDPSLGWLPYEEGKKARQPQLLKES